MGTQLTMLLLVLLTGTVCLALPRRSLDLDKERGAEPEATKEEPTEDTIANLRTTNSSHLENDLLTAVENGNITAVRNLTSKGVNVNFNNGTLLRIAAGDGHIDIVEAFIKAGAKKEYYGSALAEAAKKGHAPIVKLLLDHGADPSNAEAALKFAAENGNLETVSLLLRSGTNATADETGGSPLYRAVMEGHSDVVALLVEHGADVKRALTSNYWGDVNVDSSESYGNGWSVMHVAARFGQSMVEQLTDFGADINAKDVNGYTPLQVAIQHKKYPVAQELLRFCANTTQKNKEGTTALDLAREVQAQNVTNSTRLRSLMERMTKEIPEVISSTPFTDQGIVELKDAFERKLSSSLKTELKDLIANSTDITAAAEKVLEQKAAKDIVKDLEARNCSQEQIARNEPNCRCVPPEKRITTTTSTEPPASSTTTADTSSSSSTTTGSTTTTTTESS